MTKKFEIIESQAISTSEINLLIEDVMSKLGIRHLAKLDRCSDVCRSLSLELESRGGVTLNIVSKKFDDFSDIVTNSPIMFHHFLVLEIQGQSFLVDPTFGQFKGCPDIFVCDITGKEKDNCVKQLIRYNLPNKIFHFYINEIVKEKY